MTRISSFGNPPPEIRRAAAEKKTRHSRGRLKAHHIQNCGLLVIRVCQNWFLFSTNNGEDWNLATREHLAKERQHRHSVAG
ncbi:hypothetical protein ACTWOG_000958 [Serratia marcescens]